jgi:hypothetical protein
MSPSLPFLRAHPIKRKEPHIEAHTRRNKTPRDSSRAPVQGVPRGAYSRISRVRNLRKATCLLSSGLYCMQILASFEPLKIRSEGRRRPRPRSRSGPCPLPPTLEQVGAWQNSLHAAHLAHTRKHYCSQTALGWWSPIWRTDAKREVPGRKFPNEG